MSEIRSYIPEAFFLDRKDEAHMRVCREDLVLVDPFDEYRVVAGRGKELCLNEPFEPILQLPRSERKFLKASLGQKPHLLLRKKNKPLLVFGDWLESSGLLLVLCPNCDAESLQRALALMQRDDFACSEIASTNFPSPKHGDGAVLEYLQELFYYLDRIFSTSKELGLWTVASLTANLAGCRADFGAMTTEPLSLFPLDRMRLSAFLLCLFLSMREEASVASASASVSETEVSLSVSSVLPSGTASACGYRFLQLPAFRDILLSRRNGGWVLEASFYKKTEQLVLHTKNSDPILLLAFFQVAS